jgi:hypothetical protein
MVEFPESGTCLFFSKETKTAEKKSTGMLLIIPLVVPLLFPGVSQGSTQRILHGAIEGSKSFRVKSSFVKFVMAIIHMILTTYSLIGISFKSS